VGLGNPGPAYRDTWHNAGFRVVDQLMGLHAPGHAGDTWAGLVAGHRVRLFKPRAYMNLSGPPVLRCLRQSRLGPADLLVVHDDLDLPRGRLRFKTRGRSGGHRGVESLMDALGTDAFLRLKLGVGRPPPGVDPAAFVLTPLAGQELAYLDTVARAAAETVVMWLAHGLDAARQCCPRLPADDHEPG
jgi:PTH1 family peptidyl-tRNA hydrolase